MTLNLRNLKDEWIKIIRDIIIEYPVLSLISPKNYKNLILSMIKSIE